jgi:hypothetical protein
MNTTEPAALPYYDRSTGLIVFGILTIGLGCLAALLCVFIVLTVMIQAAALHIPASSMIPGLVMYAGMAVALTWLGIGTIQAKRWARNLMLIFSWSWLLTGIVVMITFAVVLPPIMTHLPQPEGRPPVPPSAIWGILAVMFVMYGFILIVLPGIWTFFYSSRHVKGTCEWRDPNPGWTDACPLPVLAGCIWGVVSGVVLAAMCFIPHCVVPFFGIFLTGLFSRTFCAGLAALWFFGAGLLYRLDVRGWWLMFISYLLLGLSTVLTYAFHNVIEIYKLMDYPQEQIDQFQKISLFQGHAFAWITGIFLLPFVGYLLFIKRYFRGSR